MLGVYLLLSLCAATAAIPAVAAPDVATLQDRIKGAIKGSALADALGRLTTALDTKQEIEKLYGTEGVQSYKDLKENDWYSDAEKNKKIIFADNTVMSLLSFQALIEGRKQQWAKEIVADKTGKMLIDLLGQHKLLLDPLYSRREHSAKTLQKVEELADLLQPESPLDWWKRGATDKDCSYHKELINESDSGALSRIWPVGLMYYSEPEKLVDYADYLTLITHRHPTARAASAALAIGMAHALKGSPVEVIAMNMVKAAEPFDRVEKFYKRHAQKIRSHQGFSADYIIENAMLTSDMIRYAINAVKVGCEPEEILGTTSKRQANQRSFRGSLLGYQADEAVAAAVYIMLRHPSDFKAAMKEATTMTGRTSLIASLTGALLGAKLGYKKLEAQGYKYDFSLLEKSVELDILANDTYAAMKETKHAVIPVIEKPTSSSSTFLKNVLMFGAGITGAVLVYKYIVEPYLKTA